MGFCEDCLKDAVGRRAFWDRFSCSGEFRVSSSGFYMSSGLGTGAGFEGEFSSCQCFS